MGEIASVSGAGSGGVYILTAGADGYRAAYRRQLGRACGLAVSNVG